METIRFQNGSAMKDLGRIRKKRTLLSDKIKEEKFMKNLGSSEEFVACLDSSAKEIFKEKNKERQNNCSKKGKRFPVI